MKKYVFILIFLVLFSSLLAEPYKPYPVLWIHGIGVNSEVWGAEAYKDGEAFTDSIISIETGSTYDHFLNYMNSYAIEWDKIDSSYTKPGDDAYPNKTFLEIINFDDNRGSIDYSSSYPGQYSGQGDELWHRIKKVLDEYYGQDNWHNDPKAKVILIGHSMGSLATREAIKRDVLYKDSLLLPHIEKAIFLGSPFLGSVWETPILREAHITLLAKYHPVGIGLSWIIGKIVNFIANKLPQYDWVNDFDNSIKEANQELTTFLDDKLKGFSSPVKYALQFAAIEYLIDNLTHISGGVGEGDDDMSFGSPFIKNCDSYGAESGTEFYSLRYYGFFDSNSQVRYPISYFPGLTGHEMKVAWNFGCVLEVGYIIGAFWGVIPPDWPIKGGLSLAYWQFWNNESDFACNIRSQNLNKAGTGYNAKVETYWGIIHGQEVKKYNHILKAIEEKPVIHLDSVITTDDEVFPISGTKDTVPGFIKGFWGRVDDYLLASNILKVEVNYFYPKTLHWPTELGYDGNKFKVEDIGGQTYYGWNHIEITSKNVLGENAEPKTYELLVLGGPIANIIRPGWNEAINPHGNILKTEVNLSDSIGLDSVWLAIGTPDTTAPFDTIFIKTYTGTVTSDSLEYKLYPPYLEGEYKIHWWCKNKFYEDPQDGHAFRSFYIDTTPPEIEVILPDTVVNVFSPRVDSAMPIAFNGTDNLQEKLNQPQGDSVIIQIFSSVDSIIKDTSSTSYFYGVTRLIYWNFIDNNGQKIMESGEYKVVVSLADKAGNEASDTASFYIDTEPPHIELTQPLSPDTFTSNETFIEMRYLTNEFTELNVSFVNYEDTTQKYIRLAYGDSADIDSNSVLGCTPSFGQKYGKFKV